MKFTVYILISDDGKRYTGYTSNLKRRIIQHNTGITKSTRSGKNWRVVYTEDFETKTEAIKREHFLKTGKGREFLKTIL